VSARSWRKQLCKVPGVGRKGAQRIVLELRDKINTVSVAEAPAGSRQEAGAWRDQVASGLQGLGWSAKDAEAACAEVEYLAREDPQLNVAALMKAALQTLARR
jgi:holliday junction DNA helicase RuvA